jgi:hypothetical protein
MTNLVQLNWRNIEPQADKETADTPPSTKAGAEIVPPKAKAVP